MRAVDMGREVAVHPERRQVSERGAAPRDRRPGGSRAASGPSRPRLPGDAEDQDEQPRGASRPAARPAVAQTYQPRLRGVVVVLGMLVLTLASAGLDSFIGVGLGRTTLVGLVTAALVGALLVRRRDLGTVVVAPPVVFVVVAMINLATAPSATLNIYSLATVLVRGFPAMAIATGVAFVLTLIRLAARR